jgi:hypothetical protein
MSLKAYFKMIEFLDILNWPIKEKIPTESFLNFLSKYNS